MQDTRTPAGAEAGASALFPPARAIGPGAILAGYRVLGRLAAGGPGTVYLAEHLQLGRRAAIKVLRPRRPGDSAAVAHFFAQAALAARLSHPGIVSVFDYGPVEGGAYLIMEHLPGERLWARLAREPRLPVGRTLDIGAQLAMTLAAAHEAGVVHRDLRPDSIHMVPDPAGTGQEFAKVLDFGVAALSATGAPYYAAPERELDAAASDPSSDIYSLGCVLYHLTTGALPFGGTIEELLAAHRTQLPLPPRSLEPTTPPYLDSLVLRMMAKSPRERPSSMMEVVGALSAMSRSWR